MPINWGLMDREYPQKLSDLFNPNVVQQRQTAMSDQGTMNQLRQAQLMQAAQGLQRAPELARREDVAYGQQQEQMQAQKASEMQRQKLMQLLNDPNIQLQVKQQIFTQLYPEEAAKQAFKPVAPVAQVKLSPGEVLLGPDNKPVYTAPAKPEKPEPPTNWSTVPTDKGLIQVHPVTGATRPLGVNAPARTQNALSPTAQKELFEADDTIQAARNVQNILAEAAKINNTAYSGYGAKARATLRSNLPGSSQAADATVNLDNMMTGQALESLKLIFGGMPTEGERKILLDMQASADKTPQQRQDIINRATQAAKRREQVSSSRAKALREGTYFSQNPQGQNAEQDNGWSDL